MRHSLISESREKRKMPRPWAEPMGFMIQTPPQRLNSSTNMAYSRGSTNDRGMKS